ncbi:ead/Ea22-like family protein [Enterobacter cloacae]|uniref:ead/Ea22-like family protein n=2 Tax=Enterobacter cloacae complex TaxID=354276 RepID=UPI0021478CA2|nr:ead/Ea22-like family protein [Enterobacter cloacae]
MSNIDKQALRERYSAKPTPKCHICGTEMTVQRMSGSRVTYGCSGAIYDENGCHYADGRSLADDHYEQSRLTVTDESDPDVLALLDELEAADALNKHLELAIRRAEGCSEALRRKLEAAEERIAELSELPMKSDVEKKPQNTLSGRPVYLGDGSDAKETLIAGKRDIHRYGSLITDKAWKGD